MRWTAAILVLLLLSGIKGLLRREEVDLLGTGRECGDAGVCDSARVFSSEYDDTAAAAAARATHLLLL